MIKSKVINKMLKRYLLYLVMYWTSSMIDSHLVYKLQLFLCIEFKGEFIYISL